MKHPTPTYVQIPLTKGKMALVDLADAHRVRQVSWQAYSNFGGKFRAMAKIKGKATHLARFILNPPAHLVVDHINGDGLDNRRANLRICTQAQNVANSRKTKLSRSKYRGVYPANTGYTFHSIIGYKRKRHYLGSFPTAEQAAQAYNDAAKRFHGEFATLNKIQPRRTLRP